MVIGVNFVLFIIKEGTHLLGQDCWCMYKRVENKKEKKILFVQ